MAKAKKAVGRVTTPPKPATIDTDGNLLTFQNANEIIQPDQREDPTATVMDQNINDGRTQTTKEQDIQTQVTNYELTRFGDQNTGTQHPVTNYDKVTLPTTQTPDPTTTAEDPHAWEDNRRDGLAQGARIKGTFARVYTPTENGVAQLFSIQSKTFPDFIIEDCEIEELDQDATKRVFGVVAPCNQENYLNPKSWHVGRLSDDVWQYIRENKGGQPVTPFVLYDAQDWIWESPGTAFAGAGLSQTNKKNSMLMWLLAAAAFLMN